MAFLRHWQRLILLILRKIIGSYCMRSMGFCRLLFIICVGVITSSQAYSANFLTEHAQHQANVRLDCFYLESDMSRAVPPVIIPLVEKFEGLHLKAYHDTNGIPTIGFGCTGPEVKMGMEITVAQADQMMMNKLQEFANQVDAVVKVPLNDNQFAVLVDFVYNCGIRDLTQHELLTVLNQGKYDEVPQHLIQYDRDQNGTVLNGLKRRRQAEIDLWNQAA